MPPDVRTLLARASQAAKNTAAAQAASRATATAIAAKRAPVTAVPVPAAQEETRVQP